MLRKMRHFICRLLMSRMWVCYARTDRLRGAARALGSTPPILLVRWLEAAPISSFGCAVFLDWPCGAIVLVLARIVGRNSLLINLC